MHTYMQAIIAVVSSLVFLLTFVYILLSFMSASSKKAKKVKTGTVTKIEDGHEVRRSTRYESRRRTCRRFVFRANIASNKYVCVSSTAAAAV